MRTLKSPFLMILSLAMISSGIRAADNSAISDQPAAIHESGGDGAGIAIHDSSTIKQLLVVAVPEAIISDAVGMKDLPQTAQSVTKVFTAGRHAYRFDGYKANVSENGTTIVCYLPSADGGYHTLLNLQLNETNWNDLKSSAKIVTVDGHGVFDADCLQRTIAETASTQTDLPRGVTLSAVGSNSAMKLDSGETWSVNLRFRSNPTSEQQATTVSLVE